MRNLNVIELNNTLELLNENELYAFKGGLAGGQSDVHDIPEVIIPTPGGDDGGGGYDDGGDPPTWDDNDPPYGGDGDDPFPPDGGGDDGNENGNNDASAIIAGPTLPEIWWLFTKVTGQQYDKMVHNADIASQYGKNQADNMYDALRHAMWSAMDAADIGVDKAREFHTLHETEHPGPDNSMDLHNNEWGFNWFAQHGNPDNNMQQFLHDFNQAVANGQIQTHP